MTTLLQSLLGTISQSEHPSNIYVRKKYKHFVMNNVAISFLTSSGDLAVSMAFLASLSDGALTFWRPSPWFVINMSDMVQCF